MAIRERMKHVISAQTADKARYIQLKELTGISGDVWKNFWFDRREPDAHMLESLCIAWPQYAFWLSTGITDPIYGHVAPPTWKSQLPIVRGEEQPYANAEFKYLLRKHEEYSGNELIEKKREIEDAIFDLREKSIVPAIFVSYEKIMRELGESGRLEYLLIEADKELQEIRKTRSEKTEILQNRIADLRKNFVISQGMQKGLRKIINFIWPSYK